MDSAPWEATRRKGGNERPNILMGDFFGHAIGAYCGGARPWITHLTTQLLFSSLLYLLSFSAYPSIILLNFLLPFSLAFIYSLPPPTRLTETLKRTLQSKHPPPFMDSFTANILPRIPTPLVFVFVLLPRARERNSALYLLSTSFSLFRMDLEPISK